jgi:hypothetical protein
VGRDILGVPEPVLTLKMMLNRLFGSVAVLRQRGPQWRERLIGIWT